MAVGRVSMVIQERGYNVRHRLHGCGRSRSESGESLADEPASEPGRRSRWALPCPRSVRHRAVLRRLLRWSTRRESGRRSGKSRDRRRNRSRRDLVEFVGKVLPRDQTARVALRVAAVLRRGEREGAVQHRRLLESSLRLLLRLDVFVRLVDAVEPDLATESVLLVARASERYRRGRSRSGRDAPPVRISPGRGS